MFNKILVPNHSTGRSDNGRISDCKGRERGGGRRAAGVSSNKLDEAFEMFIFLCQVWKLVKEYFHHMLVLVLFSIYLDQKEDTYFQDTILFQLFFTEFIKIPRPDYINKGYDVLPGKWHIL